MAQLPAQGLDIEPDTSEADGARSRFAEQSEPVSSFQNPLSPGSNGLVLDRRNARHEPSHNADSSLEGCLPITVPTSGLASLPHELILFILCSLDSVFDLYALIRTSSRPYLVFRAEQGQVLFSVLSNELGPVIRDAVALSKMEFHDSFKPTYFREVAAITSQYADLLSGKRHLSASTISLDELRGILPLHRAVNSIARFFASCKIQCVSQASRHSPADVASVAARIASSSELLRIKRALYRREMVSRLGGNGYHALGTRKPWRYADLRAINCGFLNLFEPWHIGQVRSVNVFLSVLCKAHLFEAPADILGAEMNEEMLTRIYFRLESLGTVLDALDKTEAGRRFKQETSLAMSRSSYDARNASRFKRCWMSCLNQQNEYVRRHRYVLDRDGREARGERMHFVADSELDPPYAWIDGLRGCYCSSWLGRLEEDLDEISEAEVKEADERKTLWNCLGFIFFDRDRIQALKQIDLCKDLQTGCLLSRQPTVQ